MCLVMFKDIVSGHGQYIETSIHMDPSEPISLDTIIYSNLGCLIDLRVGQITENLNNSTDFSVLVSFL